MALVETQVPLKNHCKIWPHFWSVGKSVSKIAGCDWNKVKESKMKKLLSFIMLCSLLCLSACTVDKNIQSDVTSSKEPLRCLCLVKMAGFFVFYW